MEALRGAMLAALFLVAGCATGPSLQQSQANVPEMAPDRARIFLYRTNSPFGAAIQPSVKLDNAVVGEAVPGGVFFCDVPPGHHVVSVTTEAEKIANVDIAAGQTSYIKMDAGFGWMIARIHLEIVPPETGVDEAGNSSLIKSQCPMG